jgi:hypothetical protein
VWQALSDARKDQEALQIATERTFTIAWLTLSLGNYPVWGAIDARTAVVS